MVAGASRSRFVEAIACIEQVAKARGVVIDTFGHAGRTVTGEHGVRLLKRSGFAAELDPTS